MTREQVIQHLEKGEYCVEEEKSCCCGIESINRHGIDLTCDECWRVSLLNVMGVQVAQRNDVTEDWDFFVKGLCFDDLPDEVQNDMHNQKPEHDEGDLEDALSRYLEENELIVLRDDERGFANEYSLIVCTREEADTINENDNYDELSRDEAAEELDRYHCGDRNDYISLRMGHDYINNC